MKTDEQLKELAKSVIKNEVYVAVGKEAIESSFMTLLVFAKEDAFPKDAVALYEEYSKSMPRSLNGYPMFMSCGYLTKDEYVVFRNHYDNYSELLNK